MSRAFPALSCAVLFSSLAAGQSTETKSTETKPAFEISDVHVSATARNPFMRGPSVRRGRFEIRYATMVDLIRTAYGIEAERVVGGPTWLEDDTFDVTAKTPEGTTAETAKPMLQALLAERFKLVVHNDTKPVPAYALKVGKRGQMKEAAGSGETGCKFGDFPEPSAP